MPPKTARCIVDWGLRLESQYASTETKTGGCPDPLDDAAWQATLRWLRAWKRNPERPSEALPDADAGSEPDVVGVIDTDKSKRRRRRNKRRRQ